MSTNIDHWVIRINDAHERPKSLIGGKAAGLARLSAIPSILTPSGFIVTTESFQEFVASNGLTAEVQSFGLSLTAGDESTAERSGEIIREAFHTRPLPTAIMTSVEKSFLSLRESMGRDEPLIVRSSAVGEDSSIDSMAGLYHSVFPILELRELFEGIRQVWASAFSPQVVVRCCELPGTCHSECLTRANGEASGGRNPRRWLGLNEKDRFFREVAGNVKVMAVVVQQLLQPHCSGVAFNRDVRQNRNGILIEALPGFSDRLVSGLQTPQSWLFDETGEVLLEHCLTPQGTRRQLARRGRTVVSRDLPPRQQMRAVLTEIRAREIAQAVRVIADSNLDSPWIDTEFVCDQRGQLYFVQARPQTAFLGDMSSAGPIASGVSEESATAIQIAIGGETASLGAASGRLLVVNVPESRNPERDDFEPAKRHVQNGDILVTRTTNIGWIRLFRRLGGIIAERGGTMSHTAIVAREQKLPAVVGAQDFIRRLEQACVESSIQVTFHESGVWSIPIATLDASNGRLLLAAMQIEQGPLMEFLRSDAPEDVPDYYDKRVEFAHFVDDDGREWTGKPDHPMCPLQFDLYFAAWGRTFDMLNFSPAERLAMPLVRSIAVPSRTTTNERWIGRIRFNSNTVEDPAEYPVVAFPTEQLARLGDRLRLNGLAPVTPHDSQQPLDDIMIYHEARKDSFHRISELVVQMQQAESATEIPFESVFDAYTDLISFAHVRAAFRRRVAGPFMAAALGGLPKSVQRYCQAMLIRASSGLFTETTHRRDIEYRRILLDVARTPQLRDLILAEEIAVSCRQIRTGYRRLYRRIVRLTANFKLERSQSDRVEEKISIGRAVETLRDDLANLEDSASVQPLLTRTLAGYCRELETLRTWIIEADPTFDFERFRQIMVLAREVPALTDCERHVQHRCHYHLRRFMRQIEASEIVKTRLPSPLRLTDLTPSEFLDIFDLYRAGKEAV